MIRGSRLVLRIYAIGLAQVAALAATLAIAREWGRGPPPPHADERRFLIDEIAAHARDRATLDARLRELRRRTGMEVLLQDHSGNVLAGFEPERRHGPGTFKTEWSGGIALGSSPPPLRPPGGPLFAIAAVLVLVGISAVLTATWARATSPPASGCAARTSWATWPSPSTRWPSGSSAWSAASASCWPTSPMSCALPWRASASHSIWRRKGAARTLPRSSRGSPATWRSWSDSPTTSSPARAWRSPRRFRRCAWSGPRRARWWRRPPAGSVPFIPAERCSSRTAAATRRWTWTA